MVRDRVPVAQVRRGVLRRVPERCVKAVSASWQFECVDYGCGEGMVSLEDLCSVGRRPRTTPSTRVPAVYRGEEGEEGPSRRWEAA